MWNSPTGSNKTKRKLRIVIVISITLCIFVIYIKRSQTYSDYDNFYLISRNLTNPTTNVSKSYSIENSKRHTYSKDDLTSTEEPSRGIHEYAGRTRANKKHFSRKAGSYRIFNWNKFRQIPFRQKPKQRVTLELAYFQTYDKAAYDIMNMEPIKFDPAFKNPCFRGGDSSGLLKDGALHCLPYFYIIGVKKSGTTDLHSRMRRHVEFCKPSFSKESQWLARMRFGKMPRSLSSQNTQSITEKGIDPRKIEFFISLFDKAAMCISYRASKRSQHDSVPYKMITAEASPSTFHMHTNWERLPGNENLTEPRYTNFHYIKHMTPNVKVIIQFRDPTTRLFSDFLHSTGGRFGESSPEVFHRAVIELIKAYKECFYHFSQRSCVYNNTLKQELRSKDVSLAESFNAGFYAVLMKDLLAVFGKTQVLPLLMTDYITNMEETLRDVFRFLDMSAVGPVTMRRMLQTGPQNVSKKKKKIGPMLDETRDMLYEFYRPYNEDMAALMNDTRYLFPKP